MRAASLVPRGSSQALSVKEMAFKILGLIHSLFSTQKPNSGYSDFNAAAWHNWLWRGKQPRQILLQLYACCRNG